MRFISVANYDLARYQHMIKVSRIMMLRAFKVRKNSQDFEMSHNNVMFYHRF